MTLRVAFILACALAACRTQPYRESDDLASQAVDLARVTTCDDPGLPRCTRDTDCDAYTTCQRGWCCSGVLDPLTCACSCNGGPPCDPTSQLCCPEDPRAVTPGPLSCRDRYLCYPVY
jgi:hypothetical protein